MADLAVQQISKAGIADLSGALAAAEVGGDAVRASSGLLIVVENADASPHTATIARPQATVNTGAFGDADLEDITLVVAAGDIGGVTVPAGYKDANNDFAITYDDVTDVTVGVFSLSNG